MSHHEELWWGSARWYRQAIIQSRWKNISRSLQCRTISKKNSWALIMPRDCGWLAFCKLWYDDSKNHKWQRQGWFEHFLLVRSLKILQSFFKLKLIQIAHFSTPQLTHPRSGLHHGYCPRALFRWNGNIHPQHDEEYVNILRKAFLSAVSRTLFTGKWRNLSTSNPSDNKQYDESSNYVCGRLSVSDFYHLL